MSIPSLLDPLRVGANGERNEDRDDRGAAEQSPPDLGREGSVVHQVTQGRDDIDAIRASSNALGGDCCLRLVEILLAGGLDIHVRVGQTTPTLVTFADVS